MPLRLVNPLLLREWSRGEVRSYKTVDYETAKAVPEGLFCENVFGSLCLDQPPKSQYENASSDWLWAMALEQEGGPPPTGPFGHVELAVPVCHTLLLGWKGMGPMSNLVGGILDLTQRQMSQVLYGRAYVVLDPGQQPLHRGQLLSFEEHVQARRADQKFEAATGGLAVRRLCDAVNLHELEARLDEVATPEIAPQYSIVRRLQAVRWFLRSGSKPSWALLDVLPILPTRLRPMVALPSGMYATSDLNDLYRRVIFENYRLKKMLELGAPSLLVNDFICRLQRAVDALFANGRRRPPATDQTNRALLSLLDAVEGERKHPFSLQ